MLREMLQLIYHPNTTKNSFHTAHSLPVTIGQGVEANGKVKDKIKPLQDWSQGHDFLASRVRACRPRGPHRCNIST